MTIGDTQLSLFPDTPCQPDAGPVDELAKVHARAADLAARLPPGLHFGTSSWSFPGWRGLVYPAARSQSELARDGLRHYAAHPLLTTVGIDRSYYAPVPVEDLQRYATQLPQGFRACAKAPAAVTAAVTWTTGTPRRAVANPDFCSAERLATDLLVPFALAFRAHAGPFVLEFPPVPRVLALEPRAFAARLDGLLGELPKEFEYAVEIRDPLLLTREYAAVLARHGAAHVFNYWGGMPTPLAQASTIRPENGTTTVIRLLHRPGTTYEEQREVFRPFDRIVQPDDRMRREVVALARRGLAAGHRVYVLVNNKAEGSAPLTIEALARAFAEA